MSELTPNLESGIYTATGLQVFERLISFFNDMLLHLIDNDFTVIIIGVLLFILALSLLHALRKVSV